LLTQSCSFLFIFPFFSRVGDASPLQSHSNDQIRSVKAQKCRFVDSIFSLLSISVYILKTSKLSHSLLVFLKIDSVSNGGNVSPPKLSADSVSGCKTLSKSENLSNPETLKTNFKKSFKELGSVENRNTFNYNPPFFKTCTTFQSATTIGVNVGSYTQGRIAGDFLSSRKAAWAERCPTKTTAAALAG
jgi:hypothetical protein